MNTIIIGIAGGTGSGKTSLAKGILSQYGEGEVAVIEQDSTIMISLIFYMKNG